MSSNSGKKSKTPSATIKLAAKEASQRSLAADPGPGDPSAAPSEAPQLVDLPAPPTPSELVVKSTTSKRSTRPSGAAITTLNEPPPGAGGSSSSKSRSKSNVEGSVAGPAASNPSVGAAREPTSSKPLTGPSGGPNSVGGSPRNSQLSHHSASGQQKQHSGRSGRSQSQPKSATGSTATSVSAGAQSGAESPTTPNTVSAAMQADSGAAVHDEDEEGEGEVEQPDTPGSTPATPPPTVSGPLGGLRGSSQADGPPSSPQVSAAPGKSVTGGSMQSSASKKRSEKSNSMLMPQTSGTAATAAAAAAAADSEKSGSSSMPPLGKNGKKVTKFRYHKRITVRTHGKTSPSAIMDKVNRKDHKAGITPSAIEEMDPQELMKRAGIKGSNKTHWRVRLRQTKRLTKNGKTVTETKVAYRDSEGNKRVKTSTDPFCKTCGKKLEECKCEPGGQN